MLNLEDLNEAAFPKGKIVENTKLDLALSFVPSWNHIGNIRQSVGSLTDSVIPDADIVAAVAMVSAELLENAFKHGSKDAQVDYTVNIAQETATITAVNSWSAQTEANLQNLVNTIQWIENFDSPLDAYIERMKKIYESDDVEGSGLGLVRIVYEGQCRLYCEVDKDSKRVQVVAKFLPREA